MPVYKAFIKIPPTAHDKKEVIIELETESSLRYLDFCAAIQCFCKDRYGVDAEIDLNILPSHH